MIHRILLGYDGSASADRAYLFASDLSRRYGAELHGLVVARPPDFGDDVEAQAAIEDAQRRYNRVLSTLKARMASDGVKAHTQLVIGHPAEQIVRYAESHGIDHIVFADSFTNDGFGGERPCSEGGLEAGQDLGVRVGAVQQQRLDEGLRAGLVAVPGLGRGPVPVMGGGEHAGRSRLGG